MKSRTAETVDETILRHLAKAFTRHNLRRLEDGPSNSWIRLIRLSNGPAAFEGYSEAISLIETAGPIIGRGLGLGDDEIRKRFTRGRFGGGSYATLAALAARFPISREELEATPHDETVARILAG